MLENIYSENILEYYLSQFFSFKERMLEESDLLNLSFNVKDSKIIDFIIKEKKEFEKTHIYKGTLEQVLFRLDPSNAFLILKNSPLFPQFKLYCEKVIQIIEKDMLGLSKIEEFLDKNHPIEKLILAKRQYHYEFATYCHERKLFNDNKDSPLKLVNAFCKFFNLLNTQFSLDEEKRIIVISNKEIADLREKLKEKYFQPEKPYFSEFRAINGDSAIKNDPDLEQQMTGFVEKLIEDKQKKEVSEENTKFQPLQKESSNKILEIQNKTNIVQSNNSTSALASTEQVKNANKTTHITTEQKANSSKSLKSLKSLTQTNLKNVKQDLTLNEYFEQHNSNSPDGTIFEQRFVDFLNFNYYSFHPKSSRKKTRELLSLFTHIKDHKQLDSLSNFINGKKAQNKDKEIEICSYRSYDKLSQQDKEKYKDQQIFEFPKYLKDDHKLTLPIVLYKTKKTVKDLVAYQVLHNPISDDEAFKATKKDVVISYPLNLIDQTKKLGEKQNIEMSLKMSLQNKELRLFSGHKKIFLDFLVNLPNIKRYTHKNKAILECLFYMLLNLKLEDAYSNNEMIYSKSLQEVFSGEEIQEFTDKNTGYISFQTLLAKCSELKSFMLYKNKLEDFLMKNARQITEFLFRGEEKVKWFVFYNRKKEMLYVYNIDAILSAPLIKENCFDDIKFSNKENGGFNIGNLITISNIDREDKNIHCIEAEIKFNNLIKVLKPQKEMSIKF